MLKEAWEQYEFYHAPLKTSSKYRYYLSYKLFYEIIGNKRVTRIDAIDIEIFIGYLRSRTNKNYAPLSANTIIGHKKDMRIFFNFMLHRDMILENPIKPNKYYKLKPAQKEVIEIPSEHMN